ncbi:AraC family transcriptional regulator [Dinghuibacter silviterrae]|uniref:AraC-like DNA-binding protein n=1 Tax=Dinghuibacter silviterrae TaxID=1539049 RepID=A0A4R8DU11_9BACT|nr:AraC family transcriptional regulator [Dinghuibacter silviterrae]TDX01406.1 AraC-like DNA-binding protein [Dinghuibacter silviterrae]
MDVEVKVGSRKNVWHGLGRQRIEIPKSVLKSRVLQDEWLKQLYICGLGYYPKAKGHYTFRKNGLPENFLFYCVDGSGWYSIGDKRFEVKPNEYFILPAGVEHAYGSEDNNPWSIYWVHYGGTSLANINKMHTVQEHFSPAYVKGGEEIFSLFAKMYRTLELGYSNDNLVFANMCLPYFLSLFLYSQRHFSGESSGKMDVIDNAIMYMREHLHENLTLHDLSSRYNYSASRFSSLFKQKTGYAPIDYFIQMKMQKASQHLDFTDKLVKDIAISMGFDDPYYFSKRFTKVIGMPPTKYRTIKKD